MGYRFLKKRLTSTDTRTDKPLSRLVLKTNISQTVEFILKEERLDYKSALMTILKSLNYEEIEELLSIIKSTSQNKFEALLDASNDLIIYNTTLEEEIYTFETKIENSFYKLYLDAKASLSTGDLIAFLLKHYFHYKKKKNRILQPACNNVLSDIIVSLKECKALLTTEINGQLYLPISKALFVFFLYDKKEGTNKFKSIIRKDLFYKKTSLYELKYQVTANRFFNRLGLDYIPSIDTNSKKYDIVVTEKKTSISKEEIYNEIDKDDFFNRKIPLLNFDSKKLINPENDIKNLDEFTKTLSLLFNDFYRKTNIKNEESITEYDLGEVFIENITQPYPKYPKEVLIRVREILKEMFLNDKDFKYSFFAIIYYLKTYYLPGWTNKFPYILDNYLGRTKGLSYSSVKKRFLDVPENPIIPYLGKIKKYIINFTPNSH